MSLEDDIMQSTFESDYHKLHINVLYTASWLNGLVTEVLLPFDLSPEQFNVLRILRGAKTSVNLKYISDRLINKQSNTSRLIDKLYAKQMVERKVAENDRRNVAIEISLKGLDIVNEASLKIKTVEEKMKNIKPKEAKEISDGLDRLRKSIQKSIIIYKIIKKSNYEI